MYQCILVGTDGSKTAELAVQHAINLAALSRAELHIASVATDFISTVAVGATGLASGGDFDPQREIGHSNCVVEAAADAARKKGVNTKTHAVTGDIVDALCHLASSLKADLLVVGNRGMQGLQRYVWSSVPDSVSHRAPCSVLIVDTRGMPWWQSALPKFGCSGDWVPCDDGAFRRSSASALLTCASRYHWLILPGM